MTDNQVTKAQARYSDRKPPEDAMKPPSLSYRKRIRKYCLAGTGIALSALMIIGIINYWDEIQHAQGLGYTGSFFVGILGGVAIIPAPTLLATFTLGGVLNPVYVGLISGLGEAIGGITVYLTGAGSANLVSKLQSKWLVSNGPTKTKTPKSLIARLYTRSRALYTRLLNWAKGKSLPWLVFITSAVVFSPFHFAGLIAGSLRMGLLRFFLLSWAGKTIRGLIIAFGGYWGLHFLLEWIGG